MASGVAIIAVESVLRTERGQPIPEGLHLYHALKTTHKIVLVSETLDAEVAGQWLRVQGLRDHTRLVIGGGRRRQIEALRAEGLSVTLLVDGSPTNVAKALSLGVTGLMFASPKYLRPEHMPSLSTGVRPWADIQEELDRQAELREGDLRVNVEPEILDDSE